MIRNTARNSSFTMRDTKGTSFAIPARVASLGMTSRVPDAVVDSLLHDFRHERVDTKRRADQKPDTRMTRSCLCGQSRNVIPPVTPWQQKIRKYDHFLGTTIHAPIECVGDRRWYQLHVGRLDDRVVGRSPKRTDRGQKHPIAFITSRSVIDHNHTGHGMLRVGVPRPTRRTVPIVRSGHGLTVLRAVSCG